MACSEVKVVKMDCEPKTGVSFPVKLDDGKELNSIGLRTKRLFVLNIKAFAFGMYADNAKMKEFLKAKFGKAPPNPTKELYDAVINSDVGMVLKVVIVFGGLSSVMIRKKFEEEITESMKKINRGQKDEELIKMAMGDAKDNIKVPNGSVIEVTRFPNYILQFKGNDEVVSKVESELLCRSYLNLYLGDDPYDEEAKERFGRSLLSLF